MANNRKEIGNGAQKYRRGEHPNSKKNLELGMAKEGDVLNPNGKPKGAIDIKTRLTRMLENIAPDKIQDSTAITEFCVGISKVTNLDAVNARLLYSAIVEGESWAVKEIFDRIAGKAPQAIDLDIQVNDWRTEAQKYGLSEADILTEAKLLIAESIDDSSGE
jgi:hypothetical protein